VAQELIKQGYKDVKALKGGWNEWLNKGFPTEPK
jgi:rhodanese-related sulfurtransferase